MSWYMRVRRTPRGAYPRWRRVARWQPRGPLTAVRSPTTLLRVRPDPAHDHDHGRGRPGTNDTGRDLGGRPPRRRGPRTPGGGRGGPVLRAGPGPARPLRPQRGLLAPGPPAAGA